MKKKREPFLSQSLHDGSEVLTLVSGDLEFQFRRLSTSIVGRASSRLRVVHEEGGGVADGDEEHAMMNERGEAGEDGGFLPAALSYINKKREEKSEV